MQPSFLSIVLTIVFNQQFLKPDYEERQLVEACRRGDRVAQQRLYSKYAKAMYNTCLRMLKVSADAEDALQMAFVEVFMKLDSFRQDSTIGAWIKRIVINTCINHLKKRKLVTIDWEGNIPDMHEEEMNGEDQDYQVERIRNAMEELPDGYRMVFSLYLLEGYDHAEIAEILDISEATSKSQFSRAKQRIREMLAE